MELGRTEVILTNYARIARPIILDYFAAASCIGSTAITIDVLKALDIPAVPFPCRVQIFNAKFIERVLREGRFPAGRQEIVEWTEGTGLWSVGLGYPKPGELNVGHLAAIVDNKYIVDASLDQASRPEHDLILPGVLVGPVSRDFRRAKHDARLQVTGPKGQVLVYEATPKTTAYLKSLDWTEPQRRIDVVRRILAQL